MWLPLNIVLVLGFVSGSRGLMFHLEPNNRKCLKEEIHKGVLVTGEYDISEQPNQVKSFGQRRILVVALY